jgi:hypothetical protein
MSRYLLILGCSQKKNPSPLPMKAMDRYTGVNFGVIKKFSAERPFPPTIDICIISAQYGFLHPDDLIQDYDLRMTPQRARELHGDILTGLRSLISRRHYREIFVNLGKDYLPAVEGFEDLVTCPVRYAGGRIGEKMSAMKQWLHHIALVSKDQTTLERFISQT